MKNIVKILIGWAIIMCVLLTCSTYGLQKQIEKQQEQIEQLEKEVQRNTNYIDMSCRAIRDNILRNY